MPRFITRAETQRRLTFYIIPVLIGLGGVVYARQLDIGPWRALALIISVSLPLYAGGNLLARYPTGRLERLAMLSGVLMLILGAAFSISGLPDSLAAFESIDRSVAGASRVIGMLSLFLGLFVVLYSVVRAGADIGEVAERFRLLSEHISEGFILSTQEGEILLVNQKVLDLFGVSRESVIGRNVRDLARAFGLETIAMELDNRAVGVASEYEVVFPVGAEQRVFLINGAPVFDPQGRHTLTMATVRDVTEHRRLTQRVERYAQELQQLVEEQTRKLHQSEERLRQILVSMNEGFLIINPQYQIRFVNAQACALLKTDSQALWGREIFDFVDGIGRSRLLQLFSRAMEQEHGRGSRQEVDFIDGLGASVPTLVSAAYVYETEEEDRGYSLVITSISELKRMQQQLLFRARELERANEELRIHDRAKDSFLSNVSHELRTPLTTIQGYLELLQEGTLGTLFADQRHALEVMDRNSQHLLTHINEIIEFSRMEIRGIQIVQNLYDPANLMRDAVEAVHPAARDKNIAVSMDAYGDHAYAWGDREKLGQVLGILLNNAVKFTDPGGSIATSVMTSPETGVIFGVRDTGIGIDPAYHEQIFMRFFQVDGSKTRQYEGAGIGLSIAKNIVNAHNGDIQVDSSPGRGSTFVVTLPNSLFDARIDVEMPAADHPARLLLVEESEERQHALTSFAPINRWAVHCAPNGYQAAHRFAEIGADIVIINDAPADVAGETTLRALMQQPGIESVSVVVLTNEATDVIKQTSQAFPGVHILFKPFTASTFLKRLHPIHSGTLDSVEQEAIEDLLTPPSERPFVIILDSDPVFREWLAMALKRRGIDCQCVPLAAQAIDAARSRFPAALFLDADMPSARLDETKRVLQHDAHTRAVPLYLMTSLPDDQASIAQNHAAGILHKPFPINELIDAVLHRS